MDYTASGICPLLQGPIKAIHKEEPYSQCTVYVLWFVFDSVIV